MRSRGHCRLVQVVLGSGAAFVPSGFATQIARRMGCVRRPVRVPTYAICCPSGDQVGRSIVAHGDAACWAAPEPAATAAIATTTEMRASRRIVRATVALGDQRPANGAGRHLTPDAANPERPSA